MNDENDHLDYLTYDPAEQPGADEVPDFKEEFEAALNEHYAEEDSYMEPPYGLPVVPMIDLEREKQQQEDDLIESFWNHQDRVGC